MSHEGGVLGLQSWQRQHQTRPDPKNLRQVWHQKLLQDQALQLACHLGRPAQPQGSQMHHCHAAGWPHAPAVTQFPQNPKVDM